MQAIHCCSLLFAEFERPQAIPASVSALITVKNLMHKTVNK